MLVIKHHSYYWRCKTINTWCSIDAHFLDWQGGYPYLFFRYKQWIISLWLSAIYRPSGNPGCKTRHRWHCVNLYFQDGVRSVSLIYLPIKAANTFIMYNHNQINCLFPHLQEWELLILRWHSCCHGCIPNMHSIELALYIIQIVSASFLLFSFTLSLMTTLFFNNTYKYIL